MPMNPNPSQQLNQLQRGRSEFGAEMKQRPHHVMLDAVASTGPLRIRSGNWSTNVLQLSLVSVLQRGRSEFGAEIAMAPHFSHLSQMLQRGRSEFGAEILSNNLKKNL